MKKSIHLRLAICVGIALFIYATVARASLDEILAPLPVAEVEAPDFSGNAASVSKSKKAATTENEFFQAILGADIHDSLIVELEESLRPNGDLALVPLRDFPDLSGYSHPFNLTVLNLPSRLTRGNVLIRFQVENEEGVLGEWNLPFRVHLYSDVWFARAHLSRGDLATPSDFEIRQIDLLAEPDAVPATLELLLRHEYSRDIAPGKPLIWKDLMQRSLVRKGDLVEVTAVNGLMAISMRAVARQDGSSGDMILLRNIDSSKEFAARVTGENRAEVAF